MCPPQLVTQDSETTSRQIEDRVAQLLSEETELACTPPLPASKISKEEREHTSWRVRQPEGRRGFLWELSALTGAWVKESFYTVGLLPPLVSQCPPKVSSVLQAHKRTGLGSLEMHQTAGLMGKASSKQVMEEETGSWCTSFSLWQLISTSKKMTLVPKFSTVLN